MNFTTEGLTWPICRQKASKWNEEKAKYIHHSGLYCGQIRRGVFQRFTRVAYCISQQISCKERVGTLSSGRYFREIGLKLISLIRKSYKRTGSCHRVVDACESYKIPKYKQKCCSNITESKSSCWATKYILEVYSTDSTYFIKTLWGKWPWKVDVSACFNLDFLCCLKTIHLYGTVRWYWSTDALFW